MRIAVALFIALLHIIADEIRAGRAGCLLGLHDWRWTPRNDRYCRRCGAE